LRRTNRLSDRLHWGDSIEKLWDYHRLEPRKTGQADASPGADAGRLTMQVPINATATADPHRCDRSKTDFSTETAECGHSRELRPDPKS